MSENILIIGAGRMGIKHALGCLNWEESGGITLVDQKKDALDEAKNNLSEQDADNRIKYFLLEDFQNEKELYSIGILSATADSRLAQCELAKNSGVKHLLLEKPLGQNLREVKVLIDYIESTDISAQVNLNMRMYEGFKKLKNDLNSWPQFEGKKFITINTGTIGISSNGIHYLDLLFYLLNAQSAEIVDRHLDETRIPSGRGENFVDYGGWAVIHYYGSDKDIVARVYISISPTSTVFGGLDFLGTHGRIAISEFSQQRVDYLRKPDSTMPIVRYAADYLPPASSEFPIPALSDLTLKWLQSLGHDPLLPAVRESIAAHKIMFQWLANGEEQERFSVT